MCVCVLGAFPSPPREALQLFHGLLAVLLVVYKRVRGGLFWGVLWARVF